MGIQPMATMFAGHLGTLELDAVGLANTVGRIINNIMDINYFETI